MGGEELDSKNIDDQFEEQKNRVGARRENRLEGGLFCFFNAQYFSIFVC